MATATRIVVYQGNDPSVDLTVSNADGPLLLGSVDLELLIKPSAATDDTDDTVTTLTVGAGLTLGATPGTLTAVFPDAALATPGERFWRLDVIQRTADHPRTTAMYGPLVVVDV